MLKRGGCVAAVVALVVGVCGCSGGEQNFQGSWTRVDTVDSSISLREAEDGFHFRWMLKDGTKRVSCSRDDFCEEFRDGDRVYEYSFRLEETSGADEIIVKCEGTPVVDEMQTVSWTDRMVIREGGRELWSYLVELNGEKLVPEVGPIRFVRISEVPF